MSLTKCEYSPIPISGANGNPERTRSSWVNWTTFRAYGKIAVVSISSLAVFTGGLYALLSKDDWYNECLAKNGCFKPLEEQPDYCFDSDPCSNVIDTLNGIGVSLLTLGGAGVLGSTIYSSNILEKNSKLRKRSTPEAISLMKLFLSSCEHPRQFEKEYGKHLPTYVEMGEFTEVWLDHYNQLLQRYDDLISTRTKAENGEREKIKPNHLELYGEDSSVSEIEDKLDEDWKAFIKILDYETP